MKRIILPIVALLISHFFSFAQICSKSQLPASLQNGLAAFYPFCGNANDVSGNGNNGTVNGATLTTDRFGNANGAYSFNGTSNYINIPNSATISIQNSFSVSVWFLMDGGGCNPRIFEINQNINSCGGYTFAVNGSSNTSRTIHAASFGSCTSAIGFNSSQSIPARQWNHLVMSIDGVAGVGKIYLNGQLIQTVNGTQIPTFSYNGNPLTIGNINSGRCDWWGGKIDDLLFFNRAITSTEVNQLYSQSSDPCSILSNVPSAPVLNYMPYGTTVAGGNGSGSASNQFNIVDVAIDLNGNIYVADALNHRIQKWAPGANSGITVAGGNGQGSAANQLNNVNGVAVDKFGNLYIGDCDNNRVQKWAPGSLFGTTVAGGNGAGFALNQLEGPSGLSIDSDGNIYIADFHNNRIQKWAPGANSGITVAGGNGAGSASNQLDGPLSVAVDATGNIYVADNRNNRVQKWAPGAISGITVAGGNDVGPAANQLNGPCLVAIDAAGNIYIADANNHRIQKWAPGANSGITVAGGNGSGTALNKIDTPLGVTFDADRNIYVADAGNNRVQKWSQQDTVNLCVGVTASPLSVTADVGNTLRWYGTNATGGSASTIATIPNTSVAGIFNYYVSQVSASGCESQRKRITVAVNAFQFNALQDSVKVCGDSAVLDASIITIIPYIDTGAGNTTYRWSNGATTRTISAKASGKYYVTVTNASGCSASDTSFVSIVKANIIQSDTTVCKGATIRLSADTLVRGLLAYYPLDNNAQDLSGNNMNGVVTGATPTTDRFGQANKAYFFNGTSDFIKVNHDARLNRLPLTVSCWFNANQQISPAGALVGKYYAASWTGWQLTLNEYGPSSQRLDPWYIRGSNNYVKNSSTTPNFHTTSIIDSSWHHIVFVIDSTSGKIYLDGNLQATANWVGPAGIPSNTWPMYFGYYPSGNAPPNTYYYRGKIDDIRLYDKALNNSEVQSAMSSTVTQYQYLWSNGATTPTIEVTPNITTKYFVTVTDGITTCKDSVTITVDDLSNFNPLQDTVKVCGDSLVLDAGAGFATYNWSNGATTRTINVKTSGRYIVTAVKASGCSASDTSFVSIVKAKILQRDTTICKGSSITLAIDSSSFNKSTPCINSSLPVQLQSGLVAYYPFCGNANDASGNGINGILYGAPSLSADRHGNVNAAYNFNGTNQYIQTGSINQTLTNKTISAWVKLSSLTQMGGGLAAVQSSTGNIFDAIVYNETSAGWGFGSDNLSRTRWSNVKEAASEWVMLTATYEYNSYKLYRNGVLISTTTQFPITSFGVTSKFNIGLRHNGGGTPFLNGVIDDVFFYNRVLSSSEILLLYNATNVAWSNGANSNRITVSPVVTTKYFVTVTDGITTCKDSVTITVDDLSNFNPLQDTVKVCGDSLVLDAGTGFATYNWSNGATTRMITAKASGRYVVTVVKASGCSTTDSSIVSIVKAKILQRDTTICKGNSLTLAIDSSFSGRTVCSKSDLPINLQNGLVAYYPFCGNANDASGFGNNGVISGPTLSTDRFGSSISSYLFNGVNNKITVANSPQINPSRISVGVWIRPNAFGPSEQYIIDKSFDVHANNSQRNWGIRLSADGKLALELKVNDQYYILKDSANGRVSLNTWNFIVFTFDGSSAKLYCNNILAISQSISGTLTTASYDLNIGFLPHVTMPPYGYFWNGQIDDIFVYNRAIDFAEIKQLNNSGRSASWFPNGATTNSIIVTPATTTKYFVTVSDGITTCKDSITVTVSNIGSFNPLQDTVKVCGDSLVLDAGAGFASYKWSNGATTRMITAKASGKYFVNVTNASGCGASDTSFVSIVNANIIQSDTTVCKGNNLTLQVNLKPIQNAVWSTGATTPSIVVNPTVKTTYKVTVTDGITTCTDSVIVDVSSSELKVTDPAAICSPGVVNLTAGAVTAGSASGLTYTYWKDSTATQALVNPDKVSVSGTYYIVGTSSTGCTSAPTPVKVTVNPLPVASIVAPVQTTICDKSTISLTARGGTTYQWLLNGVVIAGARDSIYAASQAGSYEVNVIALGCTSKVAAPVNLSLVKASVAKFSNSSTCIDVPVSFFNETDTASSGSVNYVWNFGDGQTSTLINPVYTYKRSGAFVVKLRVTPKLCSSLSDSISKNITVDVPPVGIKYPNVLAVKNKATPLSARFIANGYSYLWMPSTGLNNGAIQKPVFNASQEQLYRVRLTSPGGCITMDTVKVSVYDSSDIFVPKAFSPNKDGKNDLLQPFLVNITTLKYFRVYNRWGQLMFQSTDSRQGWDGMYNYKPQPLETYTWIAEGIDGNGTTIFRKGQTVLIR